MQIIAKHIFNFLVNLISADVKRSIRIALEITSVLFVKKPGRIVGIGYIFLGKQRDISRTNFLNIHLDKTEA